VTLFEITHGERAGWQRWAAAELASILQAHQDLPVIAWTVGPAGSVLIGQVNGLAPAAQVREVFTAWLRSPVGEVPPMPGSAQAVCAFCPPARWAGRWAARLMHQAGLLAKCGADTSGCPGPGRPLVPGCLGDHRGWAQHRGAAAVTRPRWRTPQLAAPRVPRP